MKEFKSDTELIDGTIRHIKNVQDNCIILGKRLMENGESDLGRDLIRHGLVHDSSKFLGIEWEYLKYTDAKRLNKQEKAYLRLAIDHHARTNPHHPEYWNGIKNMPKIFVAEMVCDWKARSEEFGTSIFDWIDKEAMTRFGFSKDDEVYASIFNFLNLLCDKPFLKV